MLGTLRPPYAHSESRYTWSTAMPLPFMPVFATSASDTSILPTAKGASLPWTFMQRFCPAEKAPRPSSGTMTPGSIMSAPADRSLGRRNLDTGPCVTSSGMMDGSFHSVNSVG